MKCIYQRGSYPSDQCVDCASADECWDEGAFDDDYYGINYKPTWSRSGNYEEDARMRETHSDED